MVVYIASVLLGLVVLCGCSEAIILKHPDGRVARCPGHVYWAPGQAVSDTILQRGCVDDYKEQGFLRQP